MDKLHLDSTFTYGIKLALGDIILSTNQDEILMTGTNQLDAWNNPSRYDFKRSIKSFAERKHTGGLPVASTVPIIATLRSGEILHKIAGWFNWHILNTRQDVVSWKPDLKALLELQNNMKGEIPTYTWEMKDAGELPPIGSKCKLCNLDPLDYTKFKLGTDALVSTCDNDDVVTVLTHTEYNELMLPVIRMPDINGSNRIGTVILDCIKPLEPRKPVKKTVWVGYPKSGNDGASIVWDEVPNKIWVKEYTWTQVEVDHLRE